MGHPGVKDTVDQAVPQENIQQIMDAAIEQAGRSGGLASIAALLGLLAVFLSASGYVAAFMRASNSITTSQRGGRSGRPCRPGSASPR